MRGPLGQQVTGVLGQGWGYGLITQDRKVQREGLGRVTGIIFRDKSQLHRKCTMGSLVWAGSEARPGNERRRPSATIGAVNRTEHRSSGSLRVRPPTKERIRFQDLSLHHGTRSAGNLKRGQSRLEDLEIVFSKSGGVF